MKRMLLLLCTACLWLTACAVPSESEAGGVTDTHQAETGAPSAAQPTGDECRFCGRLEGNDRWFIAEVMANGMVNPLGKDCFETTSAMGAGITLHYSAVDGEAGRRLREGEIVRITYNGCIMESYPVQIAATTVTVEDETEFEMETEVESQTASEVESETTPEVEIEVQIETEEDGDQYLVLPVSGQRVMIWDNQKPYVKDIDGNLLKAAEEKITEEVSGYSDNGGFDLQVYEGYLCLYVEVIVKLDPPVPDISVDGTEEHEMQGCGIDHEHRFFRERITK